MREVLPGADSKSMHLRVLRPEACGEIAQLTQDHAVGGPNRLTRLAGEHEHQPILGWEEPERRAQRRQIQLSVLAADCAAGWYLSGRPL